MKSFCIPFLIQLLFIFITATIMYPILIQNSSLRFTVIPSRTRSRYEKTLVKPKKDSNQPVYYTKNMTITSFECNGRIVALIDPIFLDDVKRKYCKKTMPKVFKLDSTQQLYTSPTAVDSANIRSYLCKVGLERKYFEISVCKGPDSVIDTDFLINLYMLENRKYIKVGGNLKSKNLYFAIKDILRNFMRNYKRYNSNYGCLALQKYYNVLEGLSQYMSDGNRFRILIELVEYQIHDYEYPNYTNYILNMEIYKI